MIPQPVDKEPLENNFTRREFLAGAVKSGLLLTLTGQMLLSKKALAGAYTGQSLNLVLIQPHKISGEVLRKSFEEQTGAKLNLTIVPYDVIEAQATLDIQSGANQFDVVEYWYASIGSLVENNVLQDVTGLIAKDEATIKTSDYIRSIYDPYTLYKSKRWGLPYDGDTHVLFYNTTLLERHKVKPPTTWDEISDSGENLWLKLLQGLWFRVTTFHRAVGGSGRCCCSRWFLQCSSLQPTQPLISC